MQLNRARLLRSPEAGEVAEPALDPSLVVKPGRVREPVKLVEGHPVRVEQDFADHQPPFTLEDAA